MRLGRSLASLIGEGEGSEFEVEGQRNVALDAIKAGRFNPRRNFSEAQIEELAVSIRERGLVQPLVVRPVRGEHESYEIVAGERRWRAAQRANLHEVPVVVRALSDQEAIEIAIIENVQREDLNAVEEAEGYRLLMDGHGYTQEDLVQGHRQEPQPSRQHAPAAQAARERAGPAAVWRASAGHARCLIGRADAAALAERIVNEGLTVRQVEALVQDKPAVPGKARKTKAKNADTRAAESELKRRWGSTSISALGAARRASFASATRTSTSSRICATACCGVRRIAKGSSSSADGRGYCAARAPPLAGDSDFLKSYLLDSAQGGMADGSRYRTYFGRGIGDSLRRRRTAAWFGDGDLRHADCHSGARHHVRGRSDRELFSGRCESHSIGFVLAPASAWCALAQAPACGDVDQGRGKCAATDEVKHDQSPG